MEPIRISNLDQATLKANTQLPTERKPVTIRRTKLMKGAKTPIISIRPQLALGKQNDKVFVQTMKHTGQTSPAYLSPARLTSP